MKSKNERLWPVPVTAVIFLLGLIGTIGLNSNGLAFKFSYLSLIPFSSILINSYLLYKIARRRSQVKSIVWFCVFLISVIFWSLTDILAFSAANTQTGLFARSFVIIPAFIGAPAFYIFIKDTISERTEQLIGSRILLLITSFFYLSIALATNYIFTRNADELIKRFWGYELQLGPAGSIYILFAQVIVYMSTFTVLKYYRTRKISEQKKQAKIFLLSIAIPSVGISVTNLIPALFAWPWIPIDSLYMTIMAVLMVYGLNKYQLFTINPTRISNNILEMMSESVIVTNNDFEVHYMNRSAINLLNYNPERETRQAYLESFIKEDDFFEIQGYIKSNKIIKAKKKFSELEVIAKKTGEVTPVEMSVSSVLDDKDKNAGYVFVLSDLSALQKAYAKLAEQEKKVEQKVIERTEQLYEEHAKLEASIAGLPIGFIMLDENMSIIDKNEVAGKLFGTRDGTRWYVRESLKEIGLEEEFRRMEHEAQTIDIPEITVDGMVLHIIFSPILTDKNKSIGSVIIIEDITSRKSAEKERNEFIVTASHEIRTPLSIIQGNLSNALDMGSKIYNQAGPLIENAYNASNQISALFNDILIVSDIENPNNPKPKYETTFNLQEAVDEVIDKLKDRAEQKKIPVKFSYPKTEIKINGDRDEVKESIFKLIDNAIKFTNKGHVKINLNIKSSKVEILVEDTGKGIARSETKQLFRKFVRLDNSLKRQEGGTGLGLYIAKALAVRNGGDLSLKISSKKGSTFLLVLPITK